jgi:hypothetical protein
MRRIESVAVMLVLVVLTGCGQMYWTRRDAKATLERFTADHRDCLMTTGVPVQAQAIPVS